MINTQSQINTSISEMKTKIMNELYRLEKLAKEVFPDTQIPEYNVLWNLKGKTAGYAGWESGNYYMRFNLDIAVNYPDEYMTTVIHEFCHILVR